MMANREMALKHLQAAEDALMKPDALTQALAIQRHSDLGDEKPGLWAHVAQVGGGYWVTISFDPIATPLGLRVPDGSNRNFACADLDEVFGLLHDRFGG